YTIRVDHHVPMESFCDCEYIDEHASATCEMLALAFQEKEIPLSPRAAQMLYTGLVSDNIRFTTSNTNVHSYRAGEYLFSQGVDVIASEELNFGSNYDDYLYETKVRQNSRRYGNALVAIMSKDDYKDISFPRAKEKVYVLAGIRQIKVWALFTEREPGIYNVSLRSKTIDVRPIALDYGGGGHACACGIKNITMPQIREIISRLEQIAK
ncbi:MAG: bifunctional oligoribonuclease/PAP phosphatase NrnA, partial [Erysipelotrichaceae bacterium]|nr:bifunctional oligoribonuclease/PAP phosphatase NrnA [Erysipelotrichaceae bacterium]